MVDHHGSGPYSLRHLTLSLVQFLAFSAPLPSVSGDFLLDLSHVVPPPDPPGGVCLRSLFGHHVSQHVRVKGTSCTGCYTLLTCYGAWFCDIEMNARRAERSRACRHAAMIVAACGTCWVRMGTGRESSQFMMLRFWRSGLRSVVMMPRWWQPSHRNRRKTAACGGAAL